MRVVDQDTPNIGGYTLYKGAKVFCPGRPLQLSEEFWGAEAKEFKAERFVTRPQDGTGLKMRPFGGGPTLCPGRYVMIHGHPPRNKELIASYLFLQALRGT